MIKIIEPKLLTFLIEKEIQSSVFYGQIHQMFFEQLL